MRRSNNERLDDAIQCVAKLMASHETFTLSGILSYEGRPLLDLLKVFAKNRYSIFLSRVLKDREAWVDFKFSIFAPR